MKDQNIELDITEDIDYEFMGISDLLDSYNIKLPDQSEIDRTVEMLRQYVPEVKTKRSPFQSKTYGIIFNALNEIKYMGKYFWIISFIIFLTGFYIVQRDIEINLWYKPYIMIILLAPVPFLLGIIEIFRGRDEGVSELEMSCKITEREIVLSRLLVTGIYNIILNTVLAVVLSSFNIGVEIFRAVFLWVTPFTAVCGFALLLSSRLKGGYAATVLISSWMVFVITLLSQKHVIEKIISINILTYMFLSAAGIVFAGYQIRNLLNKNLYSTGGLDKIEGKD